LNVPKDVRDRIVINPEKLEDWMIPVFMENRNARRLGKWKVTGMYDFVIDATVEDHKTCGNYAYISQSSVGKWTQQGSIYRWLNPELITKDHMMINYLFTDWSKATAMQRKDYPQTRIIQQKVELLSIEKTEQFLTQRLTQLENLEHVPQDMLPRCTSEELWQNDPTYKFYADKNKVGARSTRTVKTLAEAQLIQSGKYKGEGVIVPHQAEAKYCLYCSGRPICTQADELIQAGLLRI
jgi:hypothetical protein